MDEALNLTSTSLEENSRQTCDMGLNPSRARHHPWHPALQAALHPGVTPAALALPGPPPCPDHQLPMSHFYSTVLQGPQV